MKIFVTGGTGFIGKPTVRELEARGHTLFVLTRAEHGGLEDIVSWKDKVRTFGPEAALNLAWEGIPAFDMRTTARNVANSLGLFSFLVDIGCPKVVTASSCVEYEDPAHERHGFLREGKLFLARCGERFSAETDTAFVRAIPFFVYGPGQREASLLPTVLRNIAGGSDPGVKNPRAAHDFVYVGDVARTLADLIEKNVPAGGYDIGMGALTSVGVMANAALKAFNGKPLYEERPEPGDPVANTAALRAAIGWSPDTAPAEGIMRMAEFVRNRGSSPA